MISNKINNLLKNTGIRITEHSIGVLKGNVRGGWIDNEDVYTFYANHPFSSEFQDEIIKRGGNCIKTFCAGNIDFYKN